MHIFIFERMHIFILYLTVGCLLGRFSTSGGAKGVAKFIFSPTHRTLIYMIEFEKGRDHPPVSGIIRAVKIKSQSIDSEVFFYGILTGFRTEAQFPIIGARVLIL